MRAKIHRNLTWEKLYNIIPKKYCEIAAFIPREKNTYAAIIFPQDKEESLLSGEIKKALQKVPVSDDEHIVVFAYNVTAEGYEAIEERSATLLRLRDYFWTDERLRYIKEKY